MQPETKKALYRESASKKLIFYLISQKTVLRPSSLPRVSPPELLPLEAVAPTALAPRTYLP
jgi:hypothetical protein